MKKRYILAAIALVCVLLLCERHRLDESNWVPELEVGEQLRGVPDWYQHNYNSRDTLYARGTYEAVDITMAHTKASNQAYATIERRYDYTREELRALPYGTVDERYIILRNGGRMRAYVLVKIPYDKLP